MNDNELHWSVSINDYRSEQLKTKRRDLMEEIDEEGEKILRQTIVSNANKHLANKPFKNTTSLEADMEIVRLLSDMDCDIKDAAILALDNPGSKSSASIETEKIYESLLIQSRLIQLPFVHDKSIQNHIVEKSVSGAESSEASSTLVPRKFLIDKIQDKKNALESLVHRDYQYLTEGLLYYQVLPTF
jgi:hypothetical protein